MLKMNIKHRLKSLSSSELFLRSTTLFGSFSPLATVLVSAMFAASAIASEPPLSLQTLEAIAANDDPAVRQLKLQAEAMAEAAVAAGQLPDPQLRLGAVSLPVDSFDLSQEPMTQLQLGYRQRFAPGDSLQLRSQQVEMQSTALQSMADDRRLMNRQLLREDYFNLLQQQKMLQVVRSAAQLLEELVEVSGDYYATGRTQQQDVLQAEVEYARMRDREIEVTERLEIHQARLAKWLNNAWLTELVVSDAQLNAPVAREEISAKLSDHPRLVALSMTASSAETAVSVAREQTRPGWTLDVAYGARDGTNANGTSRSDLISAVVSIDLPIFQSQRQHRTIQAEANRLDAQWAHLQDAMRQMQSELNREWASYQRNSQRLDLFNTSLLPQAQASSEASMAAYQAGVADFTMLLQSRLTQFELELDYLRVQLEQQVALSRLHYLAGE